jgi:hypothetical protein
MDTLYSLFPDVEALLKMKPEDVAPILLKLALPQQQAAGFIPAAVTQVPTTDVIAGRDFPHHKRLEADRLVNSAWNWLERDGFIEPAPGMNGSNGWRMFTPKGAAVANGQDMQKLRDALDFRRFCCTRPSARKRGILSCGVQTRPPTTILSMPFGGRTSRSKRRYGQRAVIHLATSASA